MVTDVGTARESGLDPELITWIQEVTSGTVDGVHRLDRWRPNYFVDVRTAQGPVALFLKGPRVPTHLERRSRMLSGYGTRREGAALAALRGSDVAAPAYQAFAAEHSALLVSRVGGTGVLQPASPELRRVAMTDYARVLARTHALDLDGLTAVAELDAAQHTTPARPGPLAAVLEDYESWGPRLGTPDPLIELAVGWLADHTPAAGELRLLHGDAGPNQFLYDEHGLTAVVDWELAHLGSPLSDLGYARFREALYPSGAYPDFVTEYARESGRPVDREVLNFYTVVAGLVMLAGISIDVHRPRQRNPEALQRFWWDALSRVALCQVLGETLGLPPLTLEIHERHARAVSPMAGLLADRIAAGGSDGTGHSVLLARTLQRAEELGLDAHEADETADLLGRRIGDPVARAVAVTEIVHNDRERRLAELVGHFGRLAVHRVDAMSPLAATDSWDLPADAAEQDGNSRMTGLLLPAASRPDGSPSRSAVPPRSGRGRAAG